MPTFSKSQTQNLSGHGRTTSVATIPSTQSPTQRTCLVRSFFRAPSAIRRIADRSKAKHGGEQATGASWPKIGGTTANVDTAPTSLAIRARPKGGAEGTAPSGLDLSGRRSSRVPAPRTELYGGACTDARRIGIVTGPALPALPRCRRAAVAAAGRRRPVHADPFPPYRGWPFRSRLRRVGSPVLLSRVAVRPFFRAGSSDWDSSASPAGSWRWPAAATCVSSQRRRDALVRSGRRSCTPSASPSRQQHLFCFS